MSIDTKLKEMGLVLPKATDPVGSYVATKISGNLLYISGQISIDTEGKLIKGTVTKITEKFIFLFIEGLKSEPILDVNEVKNLKLLDSIKLGRII